MSLRVQAEDDFSEIVGNGDEWGYEVTITTPNGTSATLNALSTDVHMDIDPDTGVDVSNHRASVAFSISSLAENGIKLPHGQNYTDKKPFVVEFKDINGNDTVHKIVEAAPDRAIGGVVCFLDKYKKAT